MRDFWKPMPVSGKFVRSLSIKLWFLVWALVARLVIPRCSSLVHQFPITWSSRDRLKGIAGKLFVSCHRSKDSNFCNAIGICFGAQVFAPTNVKSQLT